MDKVRSEIKSHRNVVVNDVDRKINLPPAITFLSLLNVTVQREIRFLAGDIQRHCALLRLAVIYHATS